MKITGTWHILLAPWHVIWKAFKAGVSLLFLFVRHPSYFVEGRAGAFFDSGRNIRVEGAEFIAARGDYTNITMNFNYHVHCQRPQPSPSPTYSHITTEVDKEAGGGVKV